jgi:hypothetical protein
MAHLPHLERLRLVRHVQLQKESSVLDAPLLIQVALRESDLDWRS